VISDVIENQSGFHLCLGSGDGSLVHFTEEPLLDGHQYRCRKKFWAVTICHTHS
jgi:hypothetical protein